MVVASNVFDWNGMDATNRTHSIYIGGVGQRIRVASNVITHPSMAPGGLCNGTPIVAHGRQSDLLIEGNTLQLEPGEASEGCWGLAVDAAYGAEWGAETNDRVIIRQNRIINVGNQSIGLKSCRDCVVENNLVVQLNSFSADGIIAPNRAHSSEDALMERLTVRANTVIFGTTSGQYLSRGIVVVDQGSGHVITNNVIVGKSTGLLACFGYNLQASAFRSDYNVCHAPQSSGFSWNQGVSLDSFRASRGLDTHSRVVDPQFVASTDGTYVPAAGSPLIGAAEAASCPATDITGASRGSAPDIGAFEAR